METTQLGDLLDAHEGSAWLFRGFRLSHFQAEEGEPARYARPIVTVRSLEGISVDAGLLEMRPFKRLPKDRCYVCEGDVLIALCSPYRVACVDREAEGALATAAVAVLRIWSEARDALDPWYVAGYLNLPEVGDRIIPSKASGRNLTLEDVRSIEVPSLRIERQRALGRAARELGQVQAARRMVGSMELSYLVDGYAELIGGGGQ